MNEAQMKARISELEAKLTSVQQGVPALYQFQDRDGKWCHFMHEEHYKNTVKDGSWPIRALYTHPTQQGLDAQLYRLLDHGELIEAGDQFLWDDFTWQIDPRGIFVGTPLGCVHRPARRALAAQAKQGGV